MVDPSMTGKTENDGSIEHPSVRRETTDLSFLAVAGSIVLLALALVAVGVGARLLLRTRHPKSSRALEEASEMAMNLPGQPRLELLEPQFPAANSFAGDLKAMEARLHSYGRTDEPDFVHVPIDKAMEHVAGQLRQQQPGASAPTSQGLLGGGDANSGRLFLGASP